METNENYVYKKEVNWSLLQEGLTLPVDNQIIFGQTVGRFLKRGESRDIKIYLGGFPYKAKITNVNFAKHHNRIKDTLQIRYPKNGKIAQLLQGYFNKSYKYMLSQREIRDKNDKRILRLPDDYKEYLVIYTTEYDDSYIFETIVAGDIFALKEAVKNQPEQVMEDNFNYESNDTSASIFRTERLIKIRKLNRKIGDNLKLLYGYRCQICGQVTGEDYDSHVVEAHHIDYFINSINNDSNNQMILCPNHHRIIHKTNPTFNRSKLIYLYPNGYNEKLILNRHL